MRRGVTLPERERERAIGTSLKPWLCTLSRDYDFAIESCMYYTHTHGAALGDRFSSAGRKKRRRE